MNKSLEALTETAKRMMLERMWQITLLHQGVKLSKVLPNFEFYPLKEKAAFRMGWAVGKGVDVERAHKWAYKEEE